MTGAEWAMAVGDLFAAVALWVSVAESNRTKRRLAEARRCPACGGRAAGYIHEPDCPGYVKIVQITGRN